MLLATAWVTPNSEARCHKTQHHKGSLKEFSRRFSERQPCLAGRACSAFVWEGVEEEEDRDGGGGRWAVTAINEKKQGKKLLGKTVVFFWVVRESKVQEKNKLGRKAKSNKQKDSLAHYQIN